MADCECRAASKDAWATVRIIYCPLHASAEKLRAALVTIQTEAEFVADAKAPFSTWVAERCRAALNEAKGE